MFEEVKHDDNNIITDENIRNKKSLGLKGEHLIFLISQPRAGSTLLQKILSNHPKVHTTAEPWIMLHSVYALRSKGYEAEYQTNLAQKALKDFLETFPNGEKAYLESLRLMHTYLYECALVDSGKSYFLDKTPRYYNIIPELYQLFPEARFIILLRNPLAVLSSIVTTWMKNSWYPLRWYQHDLIKAPHLLIEGIKLLDKKCLVIKYENLLTSPEHEIEKICEYIGLSFSSEMITYDTNNTSKDALGYKAQKDIFYQGKPNDNNLNKWVQELENPQVWRLVNNYLHFLGKNTINQMEYSYEEMQKLLEKKRPHWSKLWYTFTLEQRLMLYNLAHNIVTLVRFRKA